MTVNMLSHDSLTMQSMCTCSVTLEVCFPRALSLYPVQTVGLLYWPLPKSAAIHSHITVDPQLRALYIQTLSSVLHLLKGGSFPILPHYQNVLV